MSETVKIQNQSKREIQFKDGGEMVHFMPLDIVTVSRACADKLCQMFPLVKELGAENTPARNLKGDKDKNTKGDK